MACSAASKRMTSVASKLATAARCSPSPSVHASTINRPAKHVNVTPAITVRGDALLRVEPDEAVLLIMLTSLKDAPGDALSDISVRSQTLITMLDELGVDNRDRSTTGISVAEEFDHTEESRRSLGHR